MGESPTLLLRSVSKCQSQSVIVINEEGICSRDFFTSLPLSSRRHPETIPKADEMKKITIFFSINLEIWIILTLCGDKSGEVHLSDCIKKILISSEQWDEQGVTLYNLDVVIAVGYRVRCVPWNCYPQHSWIWQS